MGSLGPYTPGSCEGERTFRLELTTSVSQTPGRIRKVEGSLDYTIGVWDSRFGASTFWILPGVWVCVVLDVVPRQELTCDACAAREATAHISSSAKAPESGGSPRTLPEFAVAALDFRRLT